MATASSSSAASRSGSAIGSVANTSPPRMKTLDVGETCMFLPLDARGCRAARSCASCLEATGCMVNTIGKCVSPYEEQYEPSKDYRTAIDQKLTVMDTTQARLNAPQSWQFPAGSVRYCSTDDATCRECTRANFWRANSTFPDSRFCVGQDGKCVCVDVCERRWYVRDDCVGSVTTQTPSYFLTGDNIGERLWRGLLGMGIFVVIVLLIMLHKKRTADRLQRVREQERQRREAARQARRHARSRQLGVDPLTLSGWETYRRDLIRKESAQHTGDHDESKTGELLDDVSSDEEVDGIRSPRAVGPTTAYVSLEESSSGNTSTRSTPTLISVHRYNEATPAVQVLAPIRSNTTRDYRASV